MTKRSLILYFINRKVGEVMVNKALQDRSTSELLGAFEHIAACNAIGSGAPNVEKSMGTIEEIREEILRRTKSTEPPKTELVNPRELKEGDKFYVQPRILCIATRRSDNLADKSLVGVVIDDPAGKANGFRFVCGMQVERIIVENRQHDPPGRWAESPGTGP